MANLSVILLDNEIYANRENVISCLDEEIYNQDELIILNLSSREFLLHKNVISNDNTLQEINDIISNCKNEKIILLNSNVIISSDQLYLMKKIVKENIKTHIFKQSENFTFKDNVIISFTKDMFKSVNGFTSKNHFVKNFSKKFNDVNNIIYPKELYEITNNSVYKDFSVIGFFQDNDPYHEKLKLFFDKNNIFLNKVNKRESFNKVYEFIKTNKNNKFILLSCPDPVFNEDIFINIEKRWIDDHLNILSPVNIKKNGWHRDILKTSIGFNKKYINLKMVEDINNLLFRNYLINLYTNKVECIWAGEILTKPRINPIIDRKIPIKSLDIIKPKVVIAKREMEDHKYYSFGEDKIIRNKKFCRIEIKKDIKSLPYKPCLCMCLYSRPDNLKEILSALKNQTYKNFEFFIWNNRPELSVWLDDIINEYKEIEINVHHSDSNMGSYARLLIPSKTKNNPIIFFDDDRIPHIDFVEYCLDRYIKFPFAVQSSWSFQIKKNYWVRTKIEKPDFEVDYCGTGGMVLDRSIFDDKRLMDIPIEWKQIEDLWLNFIAKKYHDKPLISMENKLIILKDNKDQYTKLKSVKTNLFNYMIQNGYQLVNDKKKLKISIIIVTYNRWELSKKCIESVIENTPKDVYEIIVIDNCSTDDTIRRLHLLKKNGKIHKLILNNKNLQLGGAFNVGYDNCSKDVDYILTLNNDQFVMNGWYYNMLAVFRNKDINFACLVIRGISFCLKSEIIDKETNCRFLVLNGDYLKEAEIGEGMIFKSKFIFDNIIKWYDGFPDANWRGSYHAKLMYDILMPMGFKGVEMGRPAALWQKSDMEEYNKYYKDLFESRHKTLPKEDYQYDVIRDKKEYYKWTNYLQENNIKDK